MRTPHDRLKLARLFAVNKQLFSQLPLITQHVDKKAHRTEAITNFFENAAAGCFGINVVHQKLLHACAHSQCSQGRLIQAQNRENPSHLGQLAGNFSQGRLVLGGAEKLIQRGLHLFQTGSQF